MVRLLSPLGPDGPRVSAVGRNDAFSVVGGMPAARFVEGHVSRVSAAGQVFVTCPTFDAGAEFGPVRYDGSPPAAGVAVVVAVMTGTTEAWIVSADAPVDYSGWDADYEAHDGETVRITGSHTVILPTPRKGARVTVIALNATGAGPVAVGCAPHVINGPGINGETFLLLGTAGAFVTLLSDGNGWQIVGGAADSGWLPVPLFGGAFFNYGGGFQPCEYRKVGHEVDLHGLYYYVTHPSSYATWTPCQLPLGYRPVGANLIATCIGSYSGGNLAFRTDINTDGTITGATTSGVNWTGDFMSLTGLRFFVP